MINLTRYCKSCKSNRHTLLKWSKTGSYAGKRIYAECVICGKFINWVRATPENIQKAGPRVIPTPDTDFQLVRLFVKEEEKVAKKKSTKKSAKSKKDKGAKRIAKMLKTRESRSENKAAAVTPRVPAASKSEAMKFFMPASKIADEIDRKKNKEFKKVVTVIQNAMKKAIESTDSEINLDFGKNGIPKPTLLRVLSLLRGAEYKVTFCKNTLRIRW